MKPKQINASEKPAFQAAMRDVLNQHPEIGDENLPLMHFITDLKDEAKRSGKNGAPKLFVSQLVLNCIKLNISNNMSVGAINALRKSNTGEKLNLFRFNMRLRDTLTKIELIKSHDLELREFGFTHEHIVAFALTDAPKRLFKALSNFIKHKNEHNISADTIWAAFTSKRFGDNTAGFCEFLDDTVKRFAETAPQSPVLFAHGHCIEPSAPLASAYVSPYKPL